jgi:hypothetical protein
MKFLNNNDVELFAKLMDERAADASWLVDDFKYSDLQEDKATTKHLLIEIARLKKIAKILRSSIDD